MPLAAVIIGVALAGAIVGGSFVVGAPVFAIPIVAILLAGWAGLVVARRALGRERPRPEPIHFDEEDRRTLLPSPTPAERRETRRRAAARSDGV
jgi:hypothetical protein